LTNHGPDALSLQMAMLIAQIAFHRLEEATEQPYDGKYQNQPSGPQ
jgi:deoxycytidine triphosphate deaminase